MGKGHRGGPSGDGDCSEGAFASAALVGAAITVVLFILLYKFCGVKCRKV